jgi:hypothetical protein
MTMTRPFFLIALAVSCGCSGGDADLDSRLAKLEGTNERQASTSADLAKDADSLHRGVLRFSSEASKIGEDFKRATERFNNAKRTADQASDEFKLAAADYKEAAETYRLAATVAAIAAGKLRIDDIACVALHDQLNRSLKDANIAIDTISAELVPASFQALAGSPNPTSLKSLAGRLLDPKMLDQARRAPMEAIERVSNDALAALGCGRGTG